MIRAASLALALALAALPAVGAAQKVTSVARGADGSMVLVRFDSDLQTPPPIAAFRLLDVTGGIDVPLGPALAAGGPCAGRANRLCIPLAAGAPRLENAREYALRTGEVVLVDGKAAPALLSIPPLRGKVTGERALVDSAQDKQYVFATFPRDLEDDTLVDPQIAVNGVPARILNPREKGRPLCWRPSDFDFSCHIDRLLGHGDVVTLRLVERKAPATTVGEPFASHAVQRKPPEKEADARLRLKAAYARQDGEDKGSVSLLLRDCRLATGVRLCPEIRFGGLDQPLEGWIRPYVDLLLTTEDDGNYDLGLQLQSYLYDVPVFNMIDFRVTPRRESDQKGTLSHWMYLDAEARFYLSKLQSGEFLGGFYNLIPRVGYERGSTDAEPDEPRLEASDPERFKGGAQLALDWPKGALGFLPNGGTLSADWTAYSIRERPGFPDPPGDWLHYVTATATFKLGTNVGLSLIRRSGRQAPRFEHLNTFELGFTYLQ